jgi:hypothetical protein
MIIHSTRLKLTCCNILNQANKSWRGREGEGEKTKMKERAKKTCGGLGLSV